jgi:hypothetical protein
MASTNITTFPGKVGISNANPTHTLSIGSNVFVDDTGLTVTGTITTTGELSGDGAGLSNIQTSNVIGLTNNVARIGTLETDLDSNVTRIETLETDLDSNVTRIETLETDLDSNVTRIENLESGDITITGTKTFQDDVVLESNLRVQGDLLVANTVNMTVSDPILELGSNNLNTGDIGLVMTRHGASNSNVAVFFDETADTLKLGYTLNGAGDSTLEFDSNALAVSVQGALTVGSNLEVGTANLFVDTTTGNVGIGTTSPSSRLHVNPNTTSTGTPNSTGAYIYNTNTGDATCTIRVKDSNAGDPYLSFDVAGEAGWCWGMDNSDANKMKLGATWDSLTTDTKMTIDSDGNVGIGTTSPGSKLNVHGSVSTGRNLAREVGSVISYSSQYTASRGAANIINGSKNFENGSNDWITAQGQRANAYVVIDLGAAYAVDRLVIYNQNEYSDSSREVKGFQLHGSADNSTWVTVLTSECGRSNAHETNPGWSFRIPQNWDDDTEGTSYRYWKFIMTSFHGTDGYGGITELELYEASNPVDDEVSTGSLVAQDVYSETGNFSRGATIGKGYGGTSTGANNLLVEGNVGIGTASPAQKLHVEHYGSAIGDFEGLRIANHATNLHATSRPAYEFVVSDIASGTGIGASKFAIGYRDTTSASRTDRLVIDSSGYVGIGEASPAEPLHVRANGPHILVEGLSNENAQIDFSSGPNYRSSRHRIESRHYALSGNGYRNWLAFNVNEGGESTPGTRMVIRGDGRVGIGTTDPKTTLDVTGSINTGTYGVSSGYMANRSLTIGDHNANYGGGTSGWNTNTTGFLMECLDNTEIAVHDSGTRVASFMYYQGGSTNKFTIGRNMGWGTTNVEVAGVIKNKNPTWSVYKGSTGGNNSGILQYNSNRCTPVNVTLNTVVVSGLTYFYRATITVAGRYFVGFQGFADPGQNGGGHEIYISKNGTNMVRNYMDAPTNNYNTHGGLGVVLDLAINDYLEVYSSRIMHHNANCSFYGFMIG